MCNSEISKIKNKQYRSMMSKCCTCIRRIRWIIKF
jgi:hypothetical protein